MNIEPGQIAVITGAGTGIGRALARQISRAGAHVSICDVAEDAMAQTKALCLEQAPAGTKVHTFRADVGNEADVIAFRDAVLQAHSTTHIEWLFNNAGIGGGGSFVEGDHEVWDRVFAVCWFGVYYGARAFLPALMASRASVIVNVSSVNGFWASMGPTVPHTAYSAAKFAVKGFTEALIHDLRLNAPHVRCALVMPGHVASQIAQNSQKAQPRTPERMAAARKQLARNGVPVEGIDDEAVLNVLRQNADAFRDTALTSAEQAAAIILDGVRAGRWRILVGEDAAFIDRKVREDPENAYEPAFALALAQARDERERKVRPAT